MSVPFSAHIVFLHQASTHKSMATSAFRRLCCVQLTSGSPLALSFSKSGMSWNGNRMTSASTRQKSRLAVFSDRGWVVVLFHYRPQSHLGSWWPRRADSTKTNDSQSKANADRFLVSTGFLLCWNSAERNSFDSQYFCSTILSAIVQSLPSDTPEDRRRRTVVHFVNVTPHTAKCTIDYLRANRLVRDTSNLFTGFGAVWFLPIRQTEIGIDGWSICRYLGSRATRLNTLHIVRRSSTQLKFVKDCWTRSLPSKIPSVKEFRMKEEEPPGLLHLHMQPDRGCEVHAPMKVFRPNIAIHGINVSTMV
jgi:hypothetical protein